MRSLTSIPFFLPKETFLHRLHPLFKIILGLFYFVLIFSNSKPILLICILMLVTGLYLLLRLPIKGEVTIIVIAVLLFIATIFPLMDTIWGRIVIAIAKIVITSLLVTLFILTTQPNEIFQLLKPSVPFFQAIQPSIYIFSTILAVFPSIQYDLQRAVDAEALRMGKRVMFYHFTSWLSILVVILVRTLNRAERFTDSVIDRGYTPTEGLHFLTPLHIHFGDFLLFLTLVIPGVVLWVVLFYE